MSTFDPVVIVSAARTPIGSFLGSLQEACASALGAVALKAAVERAGVASEIIDEVIMGCVLQAGQGQAPARQAALVANLPASVVCSTVNKMCGSGMKAVMSGYDLLVANGANAVLAGGMESMSNAPYLLDRARSGYRMGHNRLIDHMFCDGLEDAYDKGRLMGSFADDFARDQAFTREQQDAFAIDSLKRAQAAIAEGKFDAEIAPVMVRSGRVDIEVLMDEQPGRAQLHKIPALKPAFNPDGTVTAANASSISDGAAAMLLMRLSEATRQGLTPLARIVAHSSFAQAPHLFCSAPVGAILKLLERTGWAMRDVDLVEINEAFAVVPMIAMRELDIGHERINVHGGACALGHPIGTSGARVIVTLLHALEQHGLVRGIASVCIGGGEATAIGIELIK